jgi:hypothetical protein
MMKSLELTAADLVVSHLVVRRVAQTVAIKIVTAVGIFLEREIHPIPKTLGTKPMGMRQKPNHTAVANTNVRLVSVIALRAASPLLTKQRLN